MKRHWKKILVLFAAILIPLWALGDPPVYYAEDIRGQVVDEATGQPLQGVVVVARWRLDSAVYGANSPGSSLNTVEVVTDNAGNYFIPGWGPRLRPPFAYLSHYDPELRYFKSNYYPWGYANTVHSRENHKRSIVRTSELDGKVIKLKPFDGDWPEYGSRLRGIWSSMNNDCIRECPRLVIGLEAENKRFNALASNNPFLSEIINLESLPFSDNDREFLKRFKDEK